MPRNQVFSEAKRVIIKGIFRRAEVKVGFDSNTGRLAKAIP